jgi:succinoglycan biosynthesis protein ExoM
MPVPRITICICTYKRPELLDRLLAGIEKLATDDGSFCFSCAIVDNDANGSAQAQVERFAARSGIQVVYDIEPLRNFAVVRNRVLTHAKGDFVALIDDDEVPVPEWLSKLLEIQMKTGADGVLGPVRPYFDGNPPDWILRSKVCERPAHPTLMTMHWSQCRTGNVLLRFSIFDPNGIKFDPAYATGGEDVDFFKRATSAGHRFVWCEEAPAYELVPAERCRKSYYLRRGLLQGQISLKYATDDLTVPVRLRIGLHSLIALTLYAAALPILILGGFHLFMKYLIKGSHHVGRILGLLGIEIRSRPS